MVISVMSCRFQNTICGCLDILEVQTLLVLPCLHYSQTFLQSVQLLSKEKHSCQEKHSCNISCRTIQFPRHLLHSPFPSRPGNSIIHTNSPLSFCITVCVCLNLLKFQQGFKLVPSKSIQLQQTSTSLLFFFPPYSSYSFSKPNWELANCQSPSLSLILERTHSPPYPSASNIPTGESSHSFSQLRKKQKKAPACGARGACPPATPKHSHRSGSGRGGGSLYPF